MKKKKIIREIMCEKTILKLNNVVKEMKERRVGIKNAKKQSKYGSVTILHKKKEDGYGIK